MHHFHGSITKMQQKSQKVRWARPGFEPGTTRTLSEYHTPRPTSRCYIHILFSGTDFTYSPVFKDFYTMLVEGEPGPTPLSIVEFLYVQGEYKVTVHIVGY